MYIVSTMSKTTTEETEKKETFSIYCDPSMIERAQKIADVQDRSLNYYLCKLIEQGIEKDEKKKK